MSNNYNYHYNLGRKGYTDGTAAAAAGHKRFQEEQAQREKKNREWEESERRRGNAAMHSSSSTFNWGKPKSKQKHEASPKRESYFSWIGAILGFILAFGYAMNTPEADPVTSGIIGLVAAAMLGKIFKYVLWVGGALTVLWLLFG